MENQRKNRVTYIVVITQINLTDKDKTSKKKKNTHAEKLTFSRHNDKTIMSARREESPTHT